MRNKFTAPHDPDYHEQEFIRLIEKYYECEKESFAQLIFLTHLINESHHRRIRKYMETYNSFLYTDTIPLGKVITLNGKYMLVNSKNALASKLRRSARYDFICGLIKYRNDKRILGEEIHDDQISMEEMLKMSVDDLIELSVASSE